MGERTGHSHRHTPFYQKLASGAIAGIFGTLIIFPVDLVKTRLQTQQTGAILYKNGWDCLKKVVKGEGFVGLYRGLQPSLIGVTPEKAIKLAVNDGMRHYLSRHTRVPEHELPLIYGMISGATAGLCQVLATNPMEIVKIQMQLAGTSGGAPKTLRSVLQQLGIRGLYYGAAATLSRDIPFSIIFFTSFSLFKSLLKGPESTQPTLFRVFCSGILAGSLAAVLATPMDVVKTRIQAAIHSHGPFDITHASRPSILSQYRDIIRIEGYSALMRGAVQRCCTIAPLFGISLLVYEVQQRLLARPL
jgi:hypothetical protein